MAAVALFIVLGFLLFLVWYLKAQIELQVKQRLQYQDRGEAERTLKELRQRKRSIDHQIDMLGSEKVLSILKKDGQVDIAEFATAFGFPRSTNEDLRRSASTTVDRSILSETVAAREEFFNDVDSAFGWSSADPLGMFGPFVANRMLFCEDPAVTSGRLKGLLPKVADELARSIKERFSCFGVLPEQVREMELLKTRLANAPGEEHRRYVNCSDSALEVVADLITLQSSEQLDAQVEKTLVSDKRVCKMTLNDLEQDTKIDSNAPPQDKKNAKELFDRLKLKYFTSGPEVTLPCDDDLFAELGRLPSTPHRFWFMEKYGLCMIDLDELDKLIRLSQPQISIEDQRTWLGATIEELKVKGAEQIDLRVKKALELEPKLAAAEANLNRLTDKLRDIDGEFLLGVLRSITLSLVCLVGVSLSYNMAKYHTFEVGLFNREFLRRRRLQALATLVKEPSQSLALRMLLRERLPSPLDPVRRPDSREHLRLLKQLLSEVTKVVGSDKKP